MMVLFAIIVGHFIAVSGSEQNQLIEYTHRRKLNACLERLQYLIDERHFVAAAKMVDEITITISPVGVDTDIDVVFRFVNQSLTRYVPLIGGPNDTVLFQVGLSFYYSLLWTICHNDRLHDPPDPEIRLMHLFRLKDLIICILKGIECRTSRSDLRYHYKYRELQQITEKVDVIYNSNRWNKPVPSRWMRIMLDAATLQCVQPLQMNEIEDTSYNRMIDRMYTTAIALFIRETRSLRNAVKCDETALSQLHYKFSWMADRLPMPTALQYCVDLSKKANNESEVGRFQHLTETFYYDILARIRFPIGYIT